MFRRRAGNARLFARGVRGALLPGRGVWDDLRPLGKQGGLGAAGPSILYLAKLKINILRKLILSRVIVYCGEAVLIP